VKPVVGPEPDTIFSCRHNRRPLNREELKAWQRSEAKVAPTSKRTENADALRRLAAAGYAAHDTDA